MKRQSNLIRRLALAAGLIVAFTSTHAANFTWDGGGGDDLWSTGANWGGTAPGATGQTLFFAGSTRLTPNNTTVTSLNGITFNAGAGSFTLKGSGFTLNGNIANNSGVLQTIENAMTLNNNRTLNTGSGGITLKGAVGETGGARALIKTGTSTLTLAGANSFTGRLDLNQGTILLDAASGGSLAAGSDVTFGAFGANIVSAVNQGGTFKVLGASSGSTTVTTGKRLYLTGASGANKLIVDSNGGAGTTLEFSDFNRSGGVGSQPTLNVDLSSSGSALRFIAATVAPSNGIYAYMTVTDGVNTGFATRDTGTGMVSRYTSSTALPASGGASTNNYHTSGSHTLTGNVSANSLTIQGAGSMNGSNKLTTSTFLMEEGVGDYTINNEVVTAEAYIHQYSTNGVLTFSNTLTTDGARRLVKAGPGTVVFESAVSGLAGSNGGLDVQSGAVVLNGTLADATTVHVREGATLSGSGSVGGTTNTVVNVWAGGTLDASHPTAKALSLTGTLTLNSGATYQMNLVDGSYAALSVDGSVTLDGDLKLTLSYGPTLGEEIDLLTSTGGGISGTFATINGVAATPSFSINSYTFNLNYEANRVYLETMAIPEPQTTVLLLLAGGVMVLLYSRRKSVLK